MARSLVKAMLAAKVEKTKTSQKAYVDLRRETWVDGQGAEMFERTGVVIAPNGLTVLVWSCGFVGDPDDGGTVFQIYHGGIQYRAFAKSCCDSVITLRRAAVAFAKRAKGQR